MPDDLAAVVAAWPSLSDDQKAQILAMIDVIEDPSLEIAHD